MCEPTGVEITFPKILLRRPSNLAQKDNKRIWIIANDLVFLLWFQLQAIFPQQSFEYFCINKKHLQKLMNFIARHFQWIFFNVEMKENLIELNAWNQTFFCIILLSSLISCFFIYICVNFLVQSLFEMFERKILVESLFCRKIFCSLLSKEEKKTSAKCQKYFRNLLKLFLVKFQTRF